MAGMTQKQRSFLPIIQVPQEVAQDWCKEKNIPYFEVSAKNDINVVQAFEMLASRALSRVSGCGGSTGRAARWDGGTWELPEKNILGTGGDVGGTELLIVLLHEGLQFWDHRMSEVQSHFKVRSRWALHLALKIICGVSEKIPFSTPQLEILISKGLRSD